MTSMDICKAPTITAAIVIPTTRLLTLDMPSGELTSDHVQHEGGGEEMGWGRGGDGAAEVRWRRGR